ncbi:MAG: PilZ domain-containing protein [SAR324 cluster bacterium]|nr:PilZ domain-containing protein [SAR324 cluster bacterium]
MSERRYFWVFDRTVFDQIKPPEFTLLEGVLIVLGLSALALYLLLVVYLDAKTKLHAKRAKQLAWLKRWLEHASLSQSELTTLDRLAGDETPQARHDLLANPVRFETRIHEELQEGRALSQSFAGKMRGKLGYTSENLRIPVVSTRQLQPADPIRLVLWKGGLPQHYYGQVLESGLSTFKIKVGPEAVKQLAAESAFVELFYIRGLGLEYQFSCRPKGTGAALDELVLHHALVQEGHGPRGVRLPVLVEVMFHARSLGQDAVYDLDPDTPPAFQEKGLLLDLSNGGFCMSHNQEIPQGHYIEFKLSLKKRRQVLQLTGRVQECRPFSGGQWLSRCELRGLDTAGRNFLRQVVRLEQQNRLKSHAPVRRRTA